MDPGILLLAEQVARSSPAALVLSLAINVLLIAALKRLYRENHELHARLERFLEILLPLIGRKL